MTETRTPILDSTPFRPAHPANELVDVDGIEPLLTTEAIVDRYRRPGPHATLTLHLPFHGERGDNLDKRWSATRSDLGHLGAPETVLERLDTAIQRLPRCGYHAVITADEHDAAYCWLTAREPGETLMTVGPHPSLALAIEEVDRRPRSVGAVVDRAGAELYAVDHAEIEGLGSVEGDTDRIHKSAGDGHDQKRNQRHSEEVWNRNAKLVADALEQHTAQRQAHLVVLTGDQRATQLVAEHLAGRRHLIVVEANAGGRHEPESPARLLAAMMEAATKVQQADTAERVARVMEELGQHDRGVDGDITTLQAVEDGRVKTLFVDVARATGIAHLDDTVKAATGVGADVVVGDAPELTDGIAALLRVPYQ